MLKLIFGRAQTGKTYTLTNCLTDALRSGKNDVVLIVPEQYSFQSERDILEAIEPEFISRVKTLSFTRLLDEVGRECGGIAGKRINAGIRTIMVSRAINAVAQDLTAFVKQSGSIQFASSLAETIVEFKQAGISSEQLQEKSALMEDCRLKWKLHDIALVMAAYDGLISRLFIDPADDMNRLYNMLSNKKWFEGKEIFIDCFNGFTRGELLVLEQIIRTAANVTVTLPCESSNDEDDGAGVFSNVKKTAATLTGIARKYETQIVEVLLEKSRFDAPELEFLEKHLLSSDEAIWEAENNAVEICRADYPLDELHFVGRKIKELVRTQGYRFRDFVVIARDISKYEQIADRAMSCYGVPYHIDRKLNARNQAVSVFALAAIEAAFSFNTEAVLRWMKSGLAGFDEREIALIENYTYTWNIKGKNWLEEWTKSPYGLESRQPSDAAQKLWELENLRKRAVEILSAFASAFGFGAQGMAKALYNLAIKCNMPEQLANLYEKIYSEDKVGAEALRQSYAIFMDVLSDISECYRDAQISRDEFISAFKSALEEYQISTIPMGIDQVMFGSADRIQVGRPKVAFILGVNQDKFPAAGKGCGLLSVSERQAMIDMELPVSDGLIDNAVNELYIFYSAVCCASEKVYFLSSQVDLASEKLEKSAYLERTKKLFSKIKISEEKEQSRNNVEAIESMESAKNCYAETHNESNTFSLSLKVFLENAGIELAETTSTQQQLSPEIAKKLFGNNIRLSATTVDKYFGCPFSYFCKFGLNAKTPEQAKINALHRGSLIHFVMESALKKYGKKLADVADDVLKQDIDRFAEDFLAEISAEGFDNYQLPTVARQIKDLAFVLCRELGNQLKTTDFEPIGFELSLREGNEIEPIELELSDGGKVVLGGQIDRVDSWETDENKYLCVVDYKTGSKDFHLSDLLYGLNMQMVLYLYSAVKGKNSVFAGRIPAGVLYVPSERLIGDGNNKTKSYSGILLNDSEVLTAFDKEHSSRYIPVKYNKGGDLSAESAKIVLTEDEFDLLFCNAEDKLKQMGEELHSGHIAIDPLDGRSSSPCGYCDYRSICHRDKTMANRKVENLKKEEVMDILRGDSDGNA